MKQVAHEESDDGAPEGNARGGIQALDAALTLLRALAVFPDAVSLTDLARAANMPASKAHRYLASFVHAGLVVQRERSGRYDLGPSAAEIGLAALGRNDFVNRSADGLEELSSATGLTALLTVWGNQGATVVRWERTTSFTITSLGLGSTLPLLSSASGRVFLAFMPRRLTAARLRLEVERALEAGISWPDLDPTPESIDRLIAQVRTDRVAQVDGRFIPGLKAISAPVTNWQGDAEVAVTLIGTRDDMLAVDGSVRRQLLDYTSRLSIPQEV
ncbi:IclR family transcriptional regulator [Microvirga alba]|uniref:IclR family transcriptional regulator n=1 Tax=Microvirga alba TaxID=2791025 RepID=UPI002D21D0C4|nr:IclR family transcriptional regulator [Microvirga alba]